MKTETLERLNRYLARSGVGSRRTCDRLITEGEVQVNGKTVDQPGTKVDPKTDQVTYGGRPVRPPDVCTYIVINKPRGIVVTMDDPRGRRTVIDLVDGVEARVFPVGRLDTDTTGVLLMTDDGDLAHRLLHPKFGVNKTYVASVVGVPSDGVLKHLREGVRLDDEPTAPAGVRRMRDGTIEVVIHEGRNRQVRRMCAALGHPVVTLERSAFGPVVASGLRRGQWRRLKGDEVAALRRAVGLDEDVEA